jgi:hypothetical protein
MHCLAERPPKNYPNPKSWTSPLRQKISFGAFKNNLIHVKKLRKTTKHCKQQAVREEIEKQENSRNNQKKLSFPYCAAGNSFAFNYRSHETKIVLFCVHAKWILAV